MRYQPEESTMSRVTAPPTAPIPPKKSPDDGATARIGKSVVIKGHVISAEDLTVEGRVEGTIELDGFSLTVGAGGSVQAELKASTVIVRGSVTGNVAATDKIEVWETGSVEGGLTAPRIAIRDGAVLHGRVDTPAGASAKSGNRLPVAV